MRRQKKVSTKTKNSCNDGIKRLKALRATTFKGTTDPVDATAWINLIEKCIRVMGCPEDRKVTLVVFLLQKGVKDWWRVVENRRVGMDEPTWVKFKKAFCKKYYP